MSKLALASTVKIVILFSYMSFQTKDVAHTGQTGDFVITNKTKHGTRVYHSVVSWACPGVSLCGSLLSTQIVGPTPRGCDSAGGARVSACSKCTREF